MMYIGTGYFSEPEKHHKGWFRVFRFGSGTYEIWAGRRYLTISWK